MKLNNESLKSFEQAKTFSEHASKVNDSAWKIPLRLGLRTRVRVALIQNIFR